jgi:hypothetical protein
MWTLMAVTASNDVRMIGKLQGQPESALRVAGQVQTLQFLGQIKVEVPGVMDRRGHRAVLCSIAATAGEIGKKEP